MGKELGDRTEMPIVKVQPSISGTIKDSNGSDWSVGGYWRTPYVRIDPTKPVYAVGDSNNNSVAFVAFYNDNLTFISCVKKLGAAGTEYEIQVPTGATLARSTCTTAQKATAYLTQKVQLTINNVVTELAEDAGTLINLLDGVKSCYGYLVDGEVTTDNAVTSDYIRIDPSLELILEITGGTMGVTRDVVSFYSAKDDSSYISGIQTSTSQYRCNQVLTIPAGAKYLRVCTQDANQLQNSTRLLVKKEAYVNILISEFNVKKYEPARFLLPKYLDVVVNRQCDFFVQDTIYNLDKLPFVYTLPSSIANYGKGHLRITASGTGTDQIKLKTYFRDRYINDYLVGTQTINIRKIAKSGLSGTFNVLIVGDSLVEYGSGANPVETYKLLAEDGDVTINQIGTQTQLVSGVTYRHEGHGGWTWNKFNTDSDSPFVFNGQLSFAQYMATYFPALSGIDFCVVMLGTNDSSGYAVPGAKTFVNALLADYPNCKIAIGIPAYGRPCEGMPTDMERKLQVFAREYLDTFDNGIYNAKVTCIGHGCWIDRVNDYQHEEADSTPYSTDKFIRYTDGVHPRAQGYKQWGRAVYCKIRSWIAGNL